jgi:hypothetical protein
VTNISLIAPTGEIHVIPTRNAQFTSGLMLKLALMPKLPYHDLSQVSLFYQGSEIRNDALVPPMERSDALHLKLGIEQTIETSEIKVVDFIMREHIIHTNLGNTVETLKVWLEEQTGVPVRR